MSLLNLSDDQLESLGDILVVARAGLSPCTLILLSQRLSVLWSHLSLLWAKITLVANNDDWNPIGSLKNVSTYGHNVGTGRTDEVVEDLVTNDLDHLKGLHRRNRVDEDIAVDSDEVLRVQNAVLILFRHQ